MFFHPCHLLLNLSWFREKQTCPLAPVLYVFSYAISKTRIFHQGFGSVKEMRQRLMLPKGHQADCSKRKNKVRAPPKKLVLLRCKLLNSPICFFLLHNYMYLHHVSLRELFLKRWVELNSSTLLYKVPLKDPFKKIYNLMVPY